MIGFDDSHPLFDRKRTEHDEFYHLRKVVYADNPPIRQASVRDLVKAASIFLTKEIHWSYEQEQRMLAPLGDATMIVGSPEDPVHLFSIPPTLIQSVILGARATKVLVQEVQQIIGRPGSSMSHVRLLKVTVDDDRGGLKLALQE